MTMLDIFCHSPAEVDVQEEKNGRVKVVFKNNSSRIVIWLDTDKAGKLKDYLSAMLEDMTRRKRGDVE